MNVALTVMAIAVASTLFGQRPDVNEIYRSADVLLAQPSPAAVHRAMVRLGCADERAVPALELLLRDPRLRVRIQVYRILEEIGQPANAVARSLMKRAGSRSRWERIRVSQLTLEFDPENEEAMKLLALCSNKNYRTDAASALGAARGKDTLVLLSKLIDDRYDSVRSLAFQSVEDLGPRALSMVPALIDAMTGKRAPKLDIEDIPGAIHSGGQRLTGASRVLFTIGGDVVPQLLKRHGKGSVRVQYRVLHVLGSMGEQDAQRQAAHQSLRARDADLRRVAFACLLNLRSNVSADLPVVLDSASRYPGEAAQKRVHRYLEKLARPFRAMTKCFGKAGPKERGSLVTAVAGISIGKDHGRRLRRSEFLLLGAYGKNVVVRGATARAVATILGAESGARVIDSLLPVLRALVSTRTGVDAAVRVLRTIGKQGTAESRVAASTALSAIERR